MSLSVFVFEWSFLLLSSNCHYFISCFLDKDCLRGGWGSGGRPLCKALIKRSPRCPLHHGSTKWTWCFLLWGSMEPTTHCWAAVGRRGVAPIDLPVVDRGLGAPSMCLPPRGLHHIFGGGQRVGRRGSINENPRVTEIKPKRCDGERSRERKTWCCGRGEIEREKWEVGIMVWQCQLLISLVRFWGNLQLWARPLFREASFFRGSFFS